MVAADEDRDVVLGERFAPGLVHALAGLDDCRKVREAALGWQSDALGNRDVALVVARDADAAQALVQSGIAQRARTHVDAAARLSEVHGNADDGNGLRHRNLRNA